MFRRIALTLCAGVLILNAVVETAADSAPETDLARSGYIVASS